MASTHTTLRWTPLGHSQITGLSAAKGLGDGSLGAIPTDTCMVLVSVETQSVRWRDDGTDPTASLGMPLVAGQTWQYTTPDFSKIKFIQQTASATINLAFYK